MNVEYSTNWWLLIVTLPTQASAARMRVWRSLKAMGCVALRDGVYLLPDRSGPVQTGKVPNQAAPLRSLGLECEEAGGESWLMRVTTATDEESLAYRQRFDRREDYAEQRRAWKEAAKSLQRQAPQDLARSHRRLQREFEALQSIDFFPSDASTDAQAAWLDFNTRVNAVLSPDEPHETKGRVPRLDAKQYQGRVWATRRSLWVDRVASAWLIRRFIDPQARFQWLAKVSDCPRKALGFDFDGASFTHVGERVTFETLMASFGLDADPALLRLAAMVHALDAGGEPPPEAAGFEAVLAGARERLADDDLLLDEMSAVLDSLYAHFQREKPRKTAKRRAP